MEDCMQRDAVNSWKDSAFSRILLQNMLIIPINMMEQTIYIYRDLN